MKTPLRSHLIASPLLRAPSVALFGLLACSPLTSSEESTETIVDPDGSSVTETVAIDTGSTDTGMMDEQGSSETSPADPLGYPCDVLQQDCGDGYKCVPAGSGGHVCSPVMGVKIQGSPCIAMGLTPIIDDCDASSFCWDGVCTTFCAGETEASATCPDGLACLESGTFLGLCFGQSCNPLDAEPCPHGWPCEGRWPWIPEVGPQSTCNFVDGATHGQVTLGAPCEASLDCIEGTTCIGATDLIDCAAEHCCTAWCDPEDNLACANQPGTVCTSGSLGPGYGYCAPT